ncbi:unnamed protein product [Paramecium octaurelia]|uniref:Uncharacterized protein n=1 Tax=Paramecium octaurelia TaxID=43137 RepID=A0A8S1TJ06_PAROT|nr:unnamed protein product [Paramecium octaurelia]
MNNFNFITMRQQRINNELRELVPFYYSNQQVYHIKSGQFMLEVKLKYQKNPSKTS